MHNLFAYTEMTPGVSYPSYVSINTDDQGRHTITVRERGHNGERSATMEISREELAKMAIALWQTPQASLPPLAQGPTVEINVRVNVPANWGSRLDMQWVLEREIHADRWSWDWPKP